MKATMIKQAQIEKKQAELRHHSEVVNTKARDVKDKNSQYNVDWLVKKVDKFQKSEKQKREQINELKQKFNEDFESKQANAKENLKNIKLSEKEKIDYLVKKDEARSQMLHDVKEAIMEDVEQKREISYLRKMDQEENYMRIKTIENLKKHNLIQCILEKKERAEKVQEQRKRIAKMCSTQRAAIHN